MKKKLWVREFCEGNGWIGECDKERREKEIGKRKKEEREFLLSLTLF